VVALSDAEEFAAMAEAGDRDRLFPKLDDAQIARIAQRGERRPVRRNEVLWEVGAPRIDFYVILSGSIEIVQPLPGREESITVQGPREFTGDVDLIFGHPAVVEARAGEDGEVLALRREALLAVVQTDPELSDLFLRTFLQRRAFLIAHGKGDAVLVGSRHSGDTLRIREFLSRNGRPYTYLDVESDQGVQDLLERFGVRPEDLPALIVRGKLLLRRPTNLEIAERFGFSSAVEDGKVHDLVVVGAGPAGLAAAVYAASEGSTCWCWRRTRRAARREPAPGSRTIWASRRESRGSCSRRGPSRRPTSSEPGSRLRGAERPSAASRSPTPSSWRAAAR